MYYVYVLKLTNTKKNYYIGYTKDLKKRFEQHQNGCVKTTKNKSPKLIYYEAYETKYLALNREKSLKSSGSCYMGLIKRIETRD
jgi:putative endonuclease